MPLRVFTSSMAEMLFIVTKKRVPSSFVNCIAFIVFNSFSNSNMKKNKSAINADFLIILSAIFANVNTKLAKYTKIFKNRG